MKISQSFVRLKIANTRLTQRACLIVICIYNSNRSLSVSHFWYRHLILTNLDSYKSERKKHFEGKVKCILRVTYKSCWVVQLSNGVQMEALEQSYLEVVRLTHYMRRVARSGQLLRNLTRYLFWIGIKIILCSNCWYKINVVFKSD